jgi:hypothetical protein
MDKELFDELIESIKEGGAIMRGGQKPSREFHFPKQRARPREYVICVSRDHPEFLTYCKVYEVIPDESSAREQQIRIVDDTDECAPYPGECFIPIDLPHDVEQALQYSSESSSRS